MHFNDKTLLTIDDEPALRRGFKAYFEDSDFKVIEAENGQVGVDLFRRMRPDVILCDLRMPQMGGLEVIEIIKKESPETPLIVVSGTGLLEDATEAIRRGAWDYITKPISDMAEVEHVVNKALEKAELLAENRRYQERLEALLQERTLELGQSKNLVETIFSAMPGLIFIYEKFPDETFKLVQWNDTIKKQLGYSDADLQYSELFRFISKNDLEEVTVRIKRVFADNYTRNPVDISIVCKDGSEIDYMVTAYGAVFKEKTYIVGFGIDISGRKSAEKELLLLAAAIEQAAEEIVITDPEGTIKYVNPAFEKVSGYSRSETIGNNPRILKSGIHDEEFYRDLWRDITSGLTWRGRFVNKRADGTRFTEDAAISPVYDKSGNNMGYVSVKKDITEQLKFEARQQQSQRMESIATLAGGIAHDFNNILSAIIGSNDLAMIRSKDDPKVMRNLQRIENAGQRAKDLVQQILTFGRPQNDGAINMQPALVVKEVLKLLRASIPTTIEIRTKIDSKKTISADPTRIHQIVMNLCTNAFHAMHIEGGVLGVVLSDVKIGEEKLLPSINLKPGAYLMLEVSDTGCGMSKETQEKIFVPYFTTKETGEGTGLGLAVVHGIIENYGGEIKVYSEIGSGTVFQVYLPVSQSSLVEEDSSSDSVKLFSGDGEKIMVVDDEAHILELLDEALTDHGYQVTAFPDGVSAFNEFQKDPGKFDLLLTDMAMPGMNGKDLAARVLALRPEMPVIINTGYSALLGKDEALALGISEYLQKPVSLNELLEAVQRLLSNKK